MPGFKLDLANLVKSAEELLEPEESRIEGEVPEWVKGVYLRVGPGKFDFDDFTMNHWLDGYAILSKFELLENGLVKFQKKFLQSDAYKRALVAKKPVITEFATKAYPDPSKGIFSRIVSALVPEMTDNNSLSLYLLGHDLFATTNTTFFHQVDPHTLETGPKLDYHKLFGLNGVGVHPLRDEVTGDVYNMGFSVGAGFKYLLIKIPGGPQYHGSSESMMASSVTLTTISSRWTGSGAFFHSFGMTEKYIIFIEQPYTISIGKIAKALIKGSAFKDWLEWRPNETSRFYVIEKSSGHVYGTTFVSASPFFFVHFVNCYEEENENQIIIDICTYDNPSFLESLYLNKLRKNELVAHDQAYTQRYVIPIDLLTLSSSDLRSKKEGLNLLRGFNQNLTSPSAVRKGNLIILTPEIMTDPGFELPVLNPKFHGKPYQFFYGTGTMCQNSFSNSIWKFDQREKRIQGHWRGEDSQYPGEPTFLQNPTSDSLSSMVRPEDEDDGILISAVTDVREDKKDFLVFINSKNCKEIGRVYFKGQIPQAMHGIFLQQEQPFHSSIIPSNQL